MSKRSRMEQLIAAWQVIAGLYGASMVVYALTQPAAHTLAGVIYILLYLTAVLAGVLLWRGQPSGVTLSVIVQLLQLIQIQIAGFAFVLGGGAGPRFRFNLDLDAAAFHGGSTLEWIPFWQTRGVPIDMGINLVALLALLYLWRWRRPSQRQVAAAFHSGRPSTREVEAAVDIGLPPEWEDALGQAKPPKLDTDPDAEPR